MKNLNELIILLNSIDKVDACIIERFVVNLQAKQAESSIIHIMKNTKSKNRMILIVDPQIDFINGTLPVPGAEKAMDALAIYLNDHYEDYSHICVTCDRHNIRHCSFSEFGGSWPSHCVESSVGASIWPPLMDVFMKHPANIHFLYKGEDISKDEYSIFQNPEGAEYLDSIIRYSGITEVDICGLAGDVCVAATLNDAKKIYNKIHFNRLENFIASIGL